MANATHPADREDPEWTPARVKATIRLIADEFPLLCDALHEFLEPTAPSTPLPRIKRFALWPGVDWPMFAINRANQKSKYEWFQIRSKHEPHRGYFHLGTQYAHEELADHLAQLAGYQPRHLWAILCRIRRFRRWLQARARGRQRMAQEIVRQQAPWCTHLDAELAAKALTPR